MAEVNPNRRPGGWHSDEDEDWRGDDSRHGGSWEGSDEDREHGSHEEQRGGSSEEGDDGERAFWAGLVIAMMVTAVVIVLLVICCLKKKNKRNMSVVSLRDPPPKPAPALPNKSWSHFEVITITPQGAQTIKPTAPERVGAQFPTPPPAYRSTADLRDPRSQITLVSPPPAYDAGSGAP